jgi:hypothetical protein
MFTNRFHFLFIAALEVVLAACVPGAAIADLCQLGDSKISEVKSDQFFFLFRSSPPCMRDRLTISEFYCVIVVIVFIVVVAKYCCLFYRWCWCKRFRFMPRRRRWAEWFDARFLCRALKQSILHLSTKVIALKRA